MKKFLIMWLLLCICVSVYAQVITVTDKETGEPIEMATLASESPAEFAVTNAKGQVDISAFKGAEKIEIRILGYKTQIRSYEELLKNNSSLQLSRSNISLDQVVISATRWNQKAREVPARIIGISSRDIALQNPQTAADMLGGSGEIFIQKSQMGGGSPMIRGFSTNRLLITVDGIRMNTAIFRSGNLQNIISLDPFAIEKAEVFFGPGSVIYGSDAIGGVMSFHTLTPQLSLTDTALISGKAVSRYSSANNERTVHFDVNIGGKKWASSTSFTNFDFGDLRMGTNGPDEYLRPVYVQRQDSLDKVITNEDPLLQRPTAYSQFNMMQKLRFRPNKKWDITYGFHYSATSGFSRYDRHVRYKNGLPRSAEWSYGPQKWMMNNLNFTRIGDNKLFDQLTLRLARQDFEESRIDRDLNDNERRSRVEQVKAYSANLDLLKLIGKKYKLYYGLEAVFNDVKSTGTDEDISTGIIVFGPARYPQATWESYAAYITSQFKISPRLIVQGGARYNQFMLDAVFDTAFYPFPYTKAKIAQGALTGSLGLTYNPVEKLAVSINTSTGFRSPNVDDAGKVFDSEPGSVIIPNPALKAEYAYNVEAGIAKVFGEAVKVDMTAYYTILEDALVRRKFTLNGEDSIFYDGEKSQVLAVQNAASATVYGIQAGIEIKLPSGFGISSRFNYQKGDEELDDGTSSPLRHAAPWFGVSHLTFSANKLSLDVYAMYNGEVSFGQLPQEEQAKDYIYAMDANGKPYSPAWYTLNFKSMYQLMSHLSVSAGLENITSQRYRPYSSGIVAPGRNFMFSMKASF